MRTVWRVPHRSGPSDPLLRKSEILIVRTTVAGVIATAEHTIRPVLDCSATLRLRRFKGDGSIMSTSADTELGNENERPKGACGGRRFEAFPFDE
jgi:hypothetical protein